MTRKLSNTETKERTKRYLATMDTLARVTGQLTKWGGLGLIFFFMYKTVDSLAGKHTDAKVLLDMMGRLNMNQYAAYGVSVLCGGWAIGERLLRKRKVQHLSERLRKYETEIDGDRSSSKLLPAGKTRREDER